MARAASTCKGPGKLLILLVLITLGLLVVSVLRQSSPASMLLPRWTEAFAQDGGTSSLIYVYMDGCAHCKKFDPTWTSFASRYGGALRDAGVSASKIKNDDPAAQDLGVRGFPSVVLVSKSGEFPQRLFDGPRTVPGLAAFVSDSVSSFKS